MDLPNARNKHRVKQRARCREMLSEHLREAPQSTGVAMADLSDSKLGLHISPVDVRMHPRNKDGYRWSVLPQKEHLFEKNLSKLSTGIYTQIMQGIGVFFEAVSKNPLPSRKLSHKPLEGVREDVAVGLSMHGRGSYTECW